MAVVDKNPARLELARRLGADVTAESVAELDGERFSAAADVTGAPAAIEAAFGAVARGGRLLIFGVATAEASVRLSPFTIYNDEITVIGSMAVLNSYGAALNLVESGQVDVASLPGEPYALADFAAAFDAVRSGKGTKTQIAP